MSLLRFVADDPAAAWKAGQLVEDLGPETSAIPELRMLRVLATGEVLVITSPRARGLVEDAGARYGSCPDCSGPTSLMVDDEKLGDAGPITLLCYHCRSELQLPAEATARTRIAAIRAIVRDHSARRIDGYLVDAVTAGLLVAVYEAISPAHRERFGQVPLEKLVELGWRHAR